MMERAKKRLFIAVDISDQAREAAASYVDGLKRDWPDSRISWAKPHNLHLTLKFLGDVEETRIIGLGDAVREVAASIPSFHLEIGGTGVFPSATRPKVLWLGVR